MEFRYFLFFSVLFMLQHCSCGCRTIEPCSNQTPYPQPLVCHQDHQHHKSRFSFPDRKLLNLKKKFDVEAAQDGSGNYKSISEALITVTNVCRNTTTRIIIYVKAGVYREYVEIETTMWDITFIGDGIDRTCGGWFGHF